MTRLEDSVLECGGYTIFADKEILDTIEREKWDNMDSIVGIIDIDNGIWVDDKSCVIHAMDEDCKYLTISIVE